MDNKLVSVIVPIYNGEKFLAECIESIINQTYKNLEILLINDGSSDNSLNICRRYSEQDLRIKIIDKDNTGVSDTRNKGVKVASGQYILFVDCDDYIDKMMVEHMLNSLENQNVDAVRSLAKIYIQSGNCIYENIAELAGKRLDKEEIIANINRYITSVKKIPCFSPLLLFKKIKFVEFDTELYYIEDTEFYIRFMLNLNSIYFLAEHLYSYRYNESSASRKSDNFEKNIQGMFKSISKIRKTLKKQNLLNEHLNREIYCYEFCSIINRLEDCLGVKIRDIIEMLKRVCDENEIVTLLKNLDITFFGRYYKLCYYLFSRHSFHFLVYFMKIRKLYLAIRHL